MKKMYIVFSNNAENKMWIDVVDYNTNWTYQNVGGSCASNVFESFSLEECKEYISECEKESLEFMVFWNRNTDDFKIEKVNCTCGLTMQYMEERDWVFEKSFETKEEANNYIDDEYLKQDL